jgi:DNA processing protein
MSLIDYLRVIRSTNIGPVGFRYLFNQCGGINIIKYLEELNYKWNGRSIELKSEQEIENEINMTHKLGFSYVVFGDEYYCKHLEKIYEMSPVFMVKGNKELLKTPIVGVIGMRNASVNGISFTKQMARSVVANDLTVCSGGAIGIDTAAHLGSMPKTICVLPGAGDNLYPIENTVLFDDISRNGLLLTDVPIGSAIIKASFLRRNKIIAALSDVVCVMESGENSGALFTAKTALSYGKRILSVPGHPLDPRYEGNNHLIRDFQAGPLLSIDDVTRAYFVKNHIFKEDSNIKLVADHIIQKVYDQLDFTPIHINDLCCVCDLNISEIMCAIGELSVVNRVSIENMMVCKLILL